MAEGAEKEDNFGHPRDTYLHSADAFPSLASSNIPVSSLGIGRMLIYSFTSKTCCDT